MIFNFYFVTKFQNHESEHHHGLLWIKNAPMYGQHTNEELSDLKTCIFLMMYHCYQIHYKMHNNINTCLYVRKKNNVGYKFHYPLHPMRETKKLQPLQMGFVHFHNNTSIHKQNRFNI